MREHLAVRGGSRAAVLVLGVISDVRQVRVRLADLVAGHGWLLAELRRLWVWSADTAGVNERLARLVGAHAGPALNTAS